MTGPLARYSTLGASMAERWRWGSVEDAAGHGEGFRSRDAAARALARAVLSPVAVGAR